MSRFNIIKGGQNNEKNLPTQKAPQKDGTRFPQENGYKERPQGSRSQTCKGQKAAHILILRNQWKLITETD